MSDGLTLLQSTDSELLLAARAVSDAAKEFRDELDEALAHRIVAKLGEALG